jgi:hypothetical protein
MIIINLIVFAAWLLTARQLYRIWMRKGVFKTLDARCSHGYDSLHKTQSCHGSHEASSMFVATMALVASLFLPITLIYLAIMYKTPVSIQKQAEIITELERQNRELRGFNEPLDEPYPGMIE